MLAARHGMPLDRFRGGKIVTLIGLLAGVSTSAQTLTTLANVGSSPRNGVTIGENGVLYGTASGGGRSKSGFVFALAPPVGGGDPLTEYILHSFNPADGDGTSPGPIVIGKNGVVYGTTGEDGLTDGTVFAIVPPSTPGGLWTETVLHTFGAFPYDGWGLPTVNIGPQGALYGTTYSGGSCPAYPCNSSGTLFTLSPPTSAGGAWKETIVYNFAFGGAGAAAFPAGGLTMGKDGVLYGVSYEGGTVNLGTVFSLTAPSEPAGAWTERVLHSFLGSPSDGSQPDARLVFDKYGNLYGTTYGGGPVQHGGIAFELVRPVVSGGDWAEVVIHKFGVNPGDGSEPSSPLVFGPNGILYGTTLFGGIYGYGTVFQLTPPASQGEQWAEAVVYSFGVQDRVAGTQPEGGLAVGENGSLLGTTSGTAGFGTVFRLSSGTGAPKLK